MKVNTFRIQISIIEMNKELLVSPECIYLMHVYSDIRMHICNYIAIKWRLA